MKTTKTFPLILTIEEHETIKRRAKAAGLGIAAYLKALGIDGKIPKRK